MKKRLRGRVVSDAMDKTVVVEVKRIVTHPLYQKQFTRSRKYQAHDPNNEYKVGDLVEIQECRPISKEKKWRVIRKINSSVGSKNDSTTNKTEGC